MSKDKDKLTIKKQILSSGGDVRELITVRNKSGFIVHRAISSLMLEFKPKDVLQIMVGALILAIPVGFTEETWKLGETLPAMNIFSLWALSVVFISAFAYYNYYRGHIKKQWLEFVKRVLTTYILTFAIVALLLFIIQRAPFDTDFILAIKRIIIVSLPSSMAAAVADAVK
jgi:uncharacterized membrane protein